jgi:hypothetical protein
MAMNYSEILKAKILYTQNKFCLPPLIEEAH